MVLSALASSAAGFKAQAQAPLLRKKRPFPVRRGSDESAGGCKKKRIVAAGSATVQAARGPAESAAWFEKKTRLWMPLKGRALRLHSPRVACSLRKTMGSLAAWSASTTFQLLLHTQLLLASAVLWSAHSRVWSRIAHRQVTSRHSLVTTERWPVWCLHQL